MIDKQSIFPFLAWQKHVNRKSLKADMAAGLTGAIVLLAQGIAFAMIAGLPPEYGLYASMFVPIIAVMFGSSWHLMTGPTTATSIVILGAISPLADPNTTLFIQLALTLTFLAGLFQLFLGLARMGVLVNFVSSSVVIGFTAGAALLIMTSQIKYMLGISMPKSLSFLEKWIFLFKNLDYTDIYVLGLSSVTLCIAVFCKIFLKRLPYMLVSIIIGSALCYYASINGHNIALVGQITAQLPPLSMPNFSFEALTILAPDAFAIALLGLVQAVSVSRTIATKSKQRLNSNQEFIGQGLANIVGSFCSSYMSSGSFSRSAVNFEAGAKTPLSSIFAAIFLLLLLFLLAPLTQYLAMPAMAAVIFLVGFGLIDLESIKNIIKTSKSETTVLFVTFLATLFLDLQFAIYIGVIFSLIFHLQRISQPRIISLSPNPLLKNRSFRKVQERKNAEKDNIILEECPQLKIIRIDGSLFFGAVNHVSDVLYSIRKGRHKNLLIIANGINLIDIAGVEMLAAEAENWQAKGGKLYISGLKKKARHYIQSETYIDVFGKENIFVSKKEAIIAIYKQLDPNICAICEHRIFKECEEIV
ncbi:MAG: SulP family inorganic anion transporter [Chitinophagales bacterium]